MRECIYFLNLKCTFPFGTISVQAGDLLSVLHKFLVPVAMLATQRAQSEGGNNSLCERSGEKTGSTQGGGLLGKCQSMYPYGEQKDAERLPFRKQTSLAGTSYSTIAGGQGLLT